MTNHTRPRVLSAAVACLVAAGGCHLVLGYDEFTDQEGAGAAGGARSSATGTTGATTATGTTTGSTSSPATTTTTSASTTSTGIGPCNNDANCDDASREDCALCPSDCPCTADQTCTQLGECKISDGFACSDPVNGDPACASGSCCDCGMANTCWANCAGMGCTDQ